MKFLDNRYQLALEVQSENTLKGTTHLNFNERSRANKDAFMVLLGLYAP